MTTIATRPSTTEQAGPIDPIGPDLTRILRSLKLGGLGATLPERLALARARKMGHAAFLELLLSDEITRRDSRSAMLRAKAAGLDPTMRIDTWDEPDDLSYDRTPWSDLTSLRFTNAHHGIPDPRPSRRREDPPRLDPRAHRHPPPDQRAFLRADELFTRLRAARLDNTLETEMRSLARVELLILDFALRPLDTTQTSDF